MTPFDYNFEVPQSNYKWDCYNASTYPLPPFWSEELMYIESHQYRPPIRQGPHEQQNLAEIYSPQGQYPLGPDVYQTSPETENFEDTFLAFMQSQQILLQLGELTTIVEALQQEPVWEEDTHCEEEKNEVCKAQSKPSSFEVELISEDHETLA